MKLFYPQQLLTKVPFHSFTADRQMANIKGRNKTLQISMEQTDSGGLIISARKPFMQQTHRKKLSYSTTEWLFI